MFQDLFYCKYTHTKTHTEHMQRSLRTNAAPCVCYPCFPLSFSLILFRFQCVSLPPSFHLLSLVLISSLCPSMDLQLPGCEQGYSARLCQFRPTSGQRLTCTNTSCFIGAHDTETYSGNTIDGFFL